MASKGVAILKLLQKEDLKELNRSLKAYLKPLRGPSGSGKETIVEKEQHTLAKEYVPFLVQLLKICGAKLASIPSTDDFVACMADEIFSAMVVAIDCLSHLRSQLTGCFFEMELQRYGLVRRLMAWKRYDVALSQSYVLFRSLCQLTSIQDSKVTQATSGSTIRGGAVKRNSSTGRPSPCHDSVLRPPGEVDVESGLPALVVAAAVDLIWCIAESLEDFPSHFQMAARLPDQVTPWISVLDPGAASKQYDALFRATYKVTLIVVADPTKFESCLVQHFCTITLRHCALSTQCDQYAKVARKLFSTLSGQSPDWCSKSVEICASVFSDVMSRTELRGLWSSYDFSELVEWFARSCKTISQVEHGWVQIYELVDHIKQVFPFAPVVMTGLYAVGLVLMQEDTHKVDPEVGIQESRADDRELVGLQKLGRLANDAIFFSKACCLLQGAEKVLKLWLQMGQGSRDKGVVLLGVHTGPGNSDRGTGEVKGRAFVSAARALHYVQKSFTRFVQIMWNASCASSSEEELPHSLFNFALQKVLQLFYPAIEEGMRCNDLRENEKDIFRKGYQMALQASLAALRLSLLLNDGVQGNFELIRNMIHKLQPEEKWWLMSSTYNMGVQLFNVKQYSLACWSLDLANKAAWAKVKSSSPASTSLESRNEVVSEACAKCLALVDARNRNGEPGQARVILIDGLVQWAQAKAKMGVFKFPQSLVRSFVKLMCIENQSIDHDTAEPEVRSLYSFIRDIEPPLAQGIIGLLLEEEHAVCQTMEEQFPDNCHIMKGQIVEYLLEKLYIGPDFVLERSRVLTMECRHLRMQGPENLPSCIKYISEVVVSVEASLKDKGRNTPGRIAGLEKQLAVAYSIMGICSYEMDPCSQEFLPNVVLSFNMWRSVLNFDVIHGGVFEPEVCATTAMSEEESIVLLVYISDLLSIQGYSVLLREALEVILRVIKNSKRPTAEEEWVEYWMKGRVGHLLCAVPFPADFLSTIRKTFNATANPEEFWQGYFNIFPGSLLEGHRHSVRDFVEREHEGAGRSNIVQNVGAIEHIKNMLHARLSDGEKSRQCSLQTAGLYHLISELYFVKGDTHEAISNARAAFQLRSRLFKYVFHCSAKSASDPRSNATSKTSGNGDPNILRLREHTGPLATWSWPFHIKIEHCLSHPSQWRILGDYVESLMQNGNGTQISEDTSLGWEFGMQPFIIEVGVIYEQMGAVDEAERSFREGHRLALTQNLPWALAFFSSCLGEVQRKRQLWESAERYFMQAKQVYINDEQTDISCEFCTLSGNALLEMRTGDLVRHYWYSRQGQRKEHNSNSNVTEPYPEKSLTTALSLYTGAIASLSQLLEDFGGIDIPRKSGLLSSRETQRNTLRSLQAKGKSVSLEISSSRLEETEVAGPKTRQSKQRKHVQERTSVSNSEAGGIDMERDLSALCDGMRLTSLDSDLVRSSQFQSRRGIPEANHSGSRLRYERRNVLGKSTLQEARREELVTGSDVLEDSSTIKWKDVVQNDLELVVDVKPQGHASRVTGAGPKVYRASCGSSGHAFSIEDWSACNWTELGRKRLSRVLLQRGKCHILLGQLDEAGRMFEKAMSTLHISSLPQPEDTAVGRSSFPVEEGALLFHMSRLHLQSRKHGDELRDAGSSRGDSDYQRKGKVRCIPWLCCSFSLCRQVPLLLHKIARLLAILYVPPSWDGPSSAREGSVSPDEMSEVAAFFHQASVGTTIRQQHLAVLDSKLDDPTVEDNHHLRSFPAKDCLEKMQRVLRLDPVNLGSIGIQAREFWDCVPSSLVCCISFVSAEEVNLRKDNFFRSVGDSDAVTDWLLVTRLSVASKPVVVLLPLLPLESPPRCKSLEYSSTPYDLSGDDDDDCDNSADDQKTPPREVLYQLRKNNHPVLRRVAAEFESVLEESRLSTSGPHPVTSLEEKSIWWKWRMELDKRLSLHLRMIEDSWLGPFKSLLLGEPQRASVARSFELCTAYLFELMSSMITQEISGSITDRSFVKILLQGVGCLTASQLEKAVARMLGFLDYLSCEMHLNEYRPDCNACRWKMSEAKKYQQIQQVSKAFRAAYIVSAQGCENDILKSLIGETNGKRRSRRLPKGKAGPKSQSPLEIMLQMVKDGSFSADPHVERQPLQLILDSESQGLPWESLPILRDHEIYRMPSLGTMHAVYIRHQCGNVPELLRATDVSQAQDEKNEDERAKSMKRSSRAAKESDSGKPLDVTSVNPNNTYYILNPNGDLQSTQAAFEDWFTEQPGWKGKAGTVPTAEEYQIGLQNHDLFVYLGHGSGDQFLPERYVRRLDHCAASLLMGCSSGRLSLRGEYQPVGVVLSYLMAGCPTIIANLWDVTDGDIDRFSRCLLSSWLVSNSETANSASEKGIRDMSDCELAMRERENVNTSTQARFTSRVNSVILDNQTQRHAPFKDFHRMGSSVGQSRNACRLPHLIGASPVCYGVPTGVSK